MLRFAAFNTGSEFHLLDHMAPLAELLQMPLITTEEENTRLAHRYYPQVSTRFMPDLEFKLREIAEEFDVLFECKYWGPHLKPLFEQLYKKKMGLVFCPHGQSDKGYLFPSLAQYAIQDLVLLYGQLLRQMLQELEVPLPAHVFTGNYRLQFYQKYRSFYDELVQQEFFSLLPPQNRTLLYAPTWKDADEATSFFQYGKKVISELPSDWNLLLKTHPLLEQRNPSQFYALTALIDRRPNARLITDFPLVYPLLAKADLYLGDLSSVGYDFLSFQRPLFFLPTPFIGRLHTCGKILDPTQNLYRQLESPLFAPKKQQALYEQAFDFPCPAALLRQKIEACFKIF